MATRLPEVPPRTLRHTFVACPKGLEAWDWAWLVQEYQDRLSGAFPSVWHCDMALGTLKDTRIIGKNKFAAFTLAHRDGMVTLAIVPMYGAVPALQERWADKIAARWRELVAVLWGPLHTYWGLGPDGSPILHPIPPPTAARYVGKHTYGRI